MKKLIALLAVAPTLTFAHESYSLSELQHALEHNLSHPLVAVIALAAAASTVVIVRKVWK